MRSRFSHRARDPRAHAPHDRERRRRTLVPERVWQETERALDEKQPEVYFQMLRECGALAVIFPKLDALSGVPQPPKWHPEVDTGVHVMLALRMPPRTGLAGGALRGAPA